MIDQKYPQSAETNEYRYIDFEWLDEIAEGLTAGAEKHPGETWREIPAKEHAVRALRHLSMWLAGDESDTHLINASMRCMMACVMEREEDAALDEMMELSEKAAEAMGVNHGTPIVFMDRDEALSELNRRLRGTKEEMRIHEADT